VRIHRYEPMCETCLK